MAGPGKHIPAHFPRLLGDLPLSSSVPAFPSPPEFPLLLPAPTPFCFPCLPLRSILFSSALNYELDEEYY